MNVICITGRIGRDAEVRTTQSGTTVASFSVAVDMGYGDRKTTEWMRCAIFGKRAESGLVNYLKKGQLVAVTGQAKANGYSKDGEVRANIEISVDNLDLLGKKDQGQPQQQPQQQPQTQQSLVSGGGSLDDDIPFARIRGEYIV